MLLIASCGAGEGAVRSYQDNQGRRCSVDVEKENTRAECDSVPVPTNGCAATGGSPCFTVSPDPITRQLRNCDTCCVGSSAAPPSSLDCGLITCLTHADCLYPRGYCESSFCFMRPPDPPPAQAGSAGTG